MPRCLGSKTLILEQFKNSIRAQGQRENRLIKKEATQVRKPRKIKVLPNLNMKTNVNSSKIGILKSKMNFNKSFFFFKCPLPCAFLSVLHLDPSYLIFTKASTGWFISQHRGTGRLGKLISDLRQYQTWALTQSDNSTCKLHYHLILPFSP